jgi:Zn-dependent protease with chaperone function
MLPLFCVVGLWGIHFYQRASQAIKVRNNTIRDTDTDAAVPVYLVDTERPLAHATQILPGQSVIVVSSGLKKSLSAEEFKAVIAHEEYHIRNRDPLWNTLASIFGIAVGGRNALIASYDYPQIERAADQYAAEQCSPTAVISALRAIERMETSSTPYAQFAGNSNQPRILELLSAPYRVLFGSVVIANAHATVDERIRYLSQSEKRF